LLDHSGSGWATFLVSAYLLRALGGAAPTCAQTPQINALEVCGRKDQSAHNRAAREELERWLSAVEGAAADIEEVRDKLFSHGAPSDPNLLMFRGDGTGRCVALDADRWRQNAV
jgi:hypothetical protein